MITEEQQTIIDFLKRTGYGYGRFATSVMRQGWVSDRQMQTMKRMKAEIECNRAKIASRRKSRKSYGSDWSGGVGCSDSEAMSLGEFF